MKTRQAPFESIEDAQEYLELLSEAITESEQSVSQDLCGHIPADEQMIRCQQLLLYNLQKLSTHVRISRRILKDLKTLRNLLHAQEDEREQAARAKSAAS